MRRSRSTVSLHSLAQSLHHATSPHDPPENDEDEQTEAEEVLQAGHDLPRARTHRSQSIVTLQQRPVLTADEGDTVTGLFDRPARHPLDTEHDEVPDEDAAFARSNSPMPPEVLMEDRTGLPTFDESQARYMSMSQPSSPVVTQVADMRRVASSSGTFLSVANGPLARLAAEVRRSL
jgi:hypothetical protein